MERTDELKERIRQQPLNDRLEESRRRIGDMCSKGRCPKMTIPVQHDDDDFYINTTLADAQATIAALEETILKMGEQAAVVAKDAMAAKEQVAALQADNRTYINERHEHVKQIEQLRSQLTQRTAELQTARCDAVRAFVRGEDKMCLVCGAKEPCELNNDPSSPCTFEPTPMELLKALQQRTAELEAVKAELEQERVRLASCLIAAEGGTKDIVKQGDYGWSPAYQATLNLQAELERVRADNKALDEWRADVTVSLQRPGGAFFVDVPQHIKDLVKERDDLRTLLLALPKVEVVTGDTVVNIVQQYNFHQWMLRALQHRQGMEG